MLFEKFLFQLFRFNVFYSGILLKVLYWMGLAGWLLCVLDIMSGRSFCLVLFKRGAEMLSFRLVKYWISFKSDSQHSRSRCKDERLQYLEIPFHSWFPHSSPRQRKSTEQIFNYYIFPNPKSSNISKLMFRAIFHSRLGIKMNVADGWWW